MSNYFSHISCYYENLLFICMLNCKAIFLNIKTEVATFYFSTGSIFAIVFASCIFRCPYTNNSSYLLHLLHNHAFFLHDRTAPCFCSARRVYETSKKHSWDSEFCMWFNNETFPINGCTHRWGGSSVVKLAGEQLDDPTLKSAAPLLVVDCSLLFWHNFFWQCSYIQCHRLNR